MANSVYIYIYIYMYIYIYIYIYVFNQTLLSEYFVDNVLDKQDFICLQRIIWFQFIIFFAQSCLSQEGLNIYFDVLKHIDQTIHLEKSLSYESESSTFYENVFNDARRLTYQTLWLLFLFQYERVSEPCMTNAQSEYNDLFFSNFRKARHHSPKVGWIWKSLLWMLFQRCYHFVSRILLILGFMSIYGILKLSGVRSKGDFAAESFLSFPPIPMWLGIKHRIISLLYDIESSQPNSFMIRGFSSFFYYLMIVRPKASLWIW